MNRRARIQGWAFVIVVIILAIAFFWSGRAYSQERDMQPTQSGYEATQIGYEPGRPARWCGWWLMKHFGLNDRRLWWAHEWGRLYGRHSPVPVIGGVAWRKGHVGKVVAVQATTFTLLAGNSCGRRGQRTVCEYQQPIRKYRYRA